MTIQSTVGMQASVNCTSLASVINYKIINLQRLRSAAEYNLFRLSSNTSSSSSNMSNSHNMPMKSWKKMTLVLVIQLTNSFNKNYELII